MNFSNFNIGFGDKEFNRVYVSISFLFRLDGMFLILNNIVVKSCGLVIIIVN